MRVIGLRHGESQYNLLGLCNDDPRRSVALTDLGIRQARTVGRQLAGADIDRIYSSPLLRARSTAEIVAESLQLSVMVDSRLGDIRSGFDGRPVADYLAAIRRDPVDTRANGGESLRDYRQRVGAFLDWLAGQPADCVLLVAHEETLRMLDAYFSGCELADVVAKPFENCLPYEFS